MFLDIEFVILKNILLNNIVRVGATAIGPPLSETTPLKKLIINSI
jgi:hypothetical protein